MILLPGRTGVGRGRDPPDDRRERPGRAGWRRDSAAGRQRECVSRRDRTRRTRACAATARTARGAPRGARRPPVRRRAAGLMAVRSAVVPVAVTLNGELRIRARQVVVRRAGRSRRC
ncbi:hypothetical protein HBB16_19915 [Pseudonocardia sp. MCCB 268]|nr:hypothetical protein [Pseudonocardia cytotoxica]